MAYGMEFSNSNGKSFIGVGETVMLYWGRVAVAHTTKSNFDPHTYASAFNLPSSKRVISMMSSPAGSNVNRFINNASTWRCEVANVSESGTYYFYIFVPVDMVPAPVHGVAIYDAGGTTIFHTARPMLQMEYFRNVSYGSDRTLHTFGHTVAMQTSIANAFDIFGGGLTSTTTHQCQGNSVVQVTALFGDGSLRGSFYGYTNVGIINADFYAQFADLGNY